MIDTQHLRSEKLRPIVFSKSLDVSEAKIQSQFLSGSLFQAASVGAAQQEDQRGHRGEEASDAGAGVESFEIIMLITIAIILNLIIIITRIILIRILIIQLII